MWGFVHHDDPVKDAAQRRLENEHTSLEQRMEEINGTSAPSLIEKAWKACCDIAGQLNQFVRHHRPPNPSSGKDTTEPRPK